MSVDTPTALIRELEQLSGGGGYPDPPTLRRVEQILSTLRNRGAVRTIGMESSSIKGAFGELYSARKHQRRGIGALRQDILQDCQRLRGILGVTRVDP